jgi:hypothetical protein
MPQCRSYYAKRAILTLFETKATPTTPVSIAATAIIVEQLRHADTLRSNRKRLPSVALRASPDYSWAKSNPGLRRFCTRSHVWCHRYVIEFNIMRFFYLTADITSLQFLRQHSKKACKPYIPTMTIPFHTTCVSTLCPFLHMQTPLHSVYQWSLPLWGM